MQSPEPGIHQNIPFEDYLAWKEPGLLNSGSLKCAFESMLRMKAAVDGEIEDTDSKDRKFGRAEHCWILEGEEEFFRRHLIADSCCAIKGDGMPCTNAGKLTDGSNWFCGTHGRGNESLTEPTDFISEDELERIKRIAESIRRHKCMGMLKRKGWSELTIVWEMHGLKFKGRIDRAALEGKYPTLLDLKKHDQSDLTVWAVDGIISKYKYWLQAALYCMGIETLRGKRPHWMWLFTQSKPPFDVLPRMMNMAMFEHGKLWIEAICQQYKACLDADYFPGVWDKPNPGYAALTEWELKNTPDKLFASDVDAVNSVARY